MTYTHKTPPFLSIHQDQESDERNGEHCESSEVQREASSEKSEINTVVDAFEEIQTEAQPNGLEANDGYKYQNSQSFNGYRPSFLPPEESLSGVLAPKPLNLQQRVAELDTYVAQQVRQLDGLLNIAASLRQSKSPEEAMQAIVVQISQLLGADRTTIYEVSDDKTMLNGLAVQGDASIKVMIQSGRGIAGLVAKERRVINLRDAYEHPNFDIRVDRHTGYRTRSVLCVPMFGSQGDVIGVVQVLNKFTGTFSKEDQSLLCALAAQASITLEALKLELALASSNKRLLEAKEQLSQKLNEQELLFEIDRSITQTDDLSVIAESVLARAALVVRSEHVGLFVVDSEDHGPAFLKTSGSDDIVPLKRILLGEGIMGKVASRGQDFILVDDSFEREAIPRSLCDRCGVDVHNALAASLHDGNKVIGALIFVNCDVLSETVDADEDHPFDMTNTSEQHWLEILASFGGGYSGFDQVELSKDKRQKRLRALRYVSLIARQLGRGISAMLARKVEQQEARLSAIGQMLSGVLHDLKGPMTSISGYTQLMSRSDDPAKREQLAHTVLNKIQNFNEMTQDLISFAKGERKVLWRKVFLKQFIESVLETVKFEFEEYGVELIVNNEAGQLAYFDEGKLRRVVVNIARNARQALIDHGIFKWSLSRTDDQLIFILEDNGPGIPLMIRDRVFEVFATMGKEDGSGLGLAIVRQIVDDHEGQIDLSTKTGLGTRFVISIPQDGRQS